jgi:hypothetical protein
MPEGQSDASLNLGKIRLAQAAGLVTHECGVKGGQFGPDP